MKQSKSLIITLTTKLANPCNIFFNFTEMKKYIRATITTKLLLYVSSSPNSRKILPAVEQFENPGYENLHIHAEKKSSYTSKQTGAGFTFNQKALIRTTSPFS